jgi:hypothetical protein
MNSTNPERPPFRNSDWLRLTHDPVKDPMMEKHSLQLGSLLPRNFRTDYKEQVSFAGEGVFYRRTSREGAGQAVFDEIAISGNTLTRRVISISSGEANTTILELDNELGINKAVLRRDMCTPGTTCPDKFVCQVIYEKSASPGLIPALLRKEPKGMRIEARFPDFHFEQRERHSAPPLEDRVYDYTQTDIWRHGMKTETFTDISEIGKRPHAAFIAVRRSIGLRLGAEILSNSESIISTAKTKFREA